MHWLLECTPAFRVWVRAFTPQVSMLIRDDVRQCMRVMQVAAAAQGQH